MVSVTHTQRWAQQSPRWRPAYEGGFDPNRYQVMELDEPATAAFIAAHHYAPALPSTTYRYGMLDHAGTGPRLVGVATLGVPMHKSVLTTVFPTLVPYYEALDFNRLVLLDQVPSNGESWFCGQMLRHAAAQHGVRGVVTFADPVPRWRIRSGRHELIKPGHVGIVYQALGFDALGRSTPRSLILLPDATALTARSVAKVTGGERGAGGVIARLMAFGAPPPEPGCDVRVWLDIALRCVGARRIRHPGNHRYAVRIGTRAQRTRTVIALPARAYPKPQPELAVA
ncbi:hypothetical protein [Actinophytocola sp.]|uniref:Mom family adenine methylcarbamoylation protein n=1 Tax=Actinophytocola sp. TaxID=1872138 RepID=UPI002D7E4D0E|nr:hypothetical protein [Actinophytocola sp.]HET9144025.1 hypothetical protein [Actinophytocola sp.]